MIAAIQDVLVRNAAEFDRLPEDGLWEVVDGRAILLPGNDVLHQQVSFRLSRKLADQVESLGCGFVLPTVNVFIPRPAGALGELQNRVPDLVVSRLMPARRFEVGDPPDLAIEILATRRGNVERSEKMDDYALAGIGEYWIVNPFRREVEIYRLSGGDYVRIENTPGEPLRPLAFPGVEIRAHEIWPA